VGVLAKLKSTCAFILGFYEMLDCLYFRGTLQAPQAHIPFNDLHSYAYNLPNILALENSGYYYKN
jgi:hypothetical protein